MSRPPLPPSRRKAAVFAVRLSLDELAAIKTRAQARGIKAATWARSILVGASRVLMIALVLLSCATSHKLDAQKTSSSATVTNTDATRTTTTLPSTVVKFGPTGVATEITYYSGSIETLKTISQMQAQINDLLKIKTEDTRKPGGIFSLWWLLGLGPVALGALLWRLKPSWLGFLWKLLGRSP